MLEAISVQLVPLFVEISNFTLSVILVDHCILTEFPIFHPVESLGLVIKSFVNLKKLLLIS